MTYYVQLQEEIERRIESFIFREGLQVERSSRTRFAEAVPEELFEKAYAAMYAEFKAAGDMHDAVVASLPEPQRDWVRYEPYTPRRRDENGDFPATLSEWRRLYWKEAEANRRA